MRLELATRASVNKSELRCRRLDKKKRRKNDEEGRRIIIIEAKINNVIIKRRERRRSFNHRSVISVLVHTVKAIVFLADPKKPVNHHTDQRLD